MSDVRLQFFDSRNNISSFTQTKPYIHRDDDILIETLARQKSINYILYCHHFLSKNWQKSLLSTYRTHLSFQFANKTDSNFDILTPPKSLYKDLRPGIEFSFFDNRFIIYNPDLKAKSYSFHYNQHVLPVIIPLETKLMSIELENLIKSLECNRIEHGQILAQVNDYRINQIYFIPIRNLNLAYTYQDTQKKSNSGDKNPVSQITNSDSSLFSFNLTNLLLQNSEICIDPSPNVSRFHSCLDWHEKMWLSYHHNFQSQQLPQKNIKTSKTCSESCSKSIKMLDLHPDIFNYYKSIVPKSK